MVGTMSIRFALVYIWELECFFEFDDNDFTLTMILTLILINEIFKKKALEVLHKNSKRIFDNLLFY